MEHQESHNDLLNGEDTGDVITDKMITKFKRRYEEGYDLYDPLYQKWLDANNLGSSTLSSILANFEDVPVLNPVAVIDTETTTSSTSSVTSNIPEDVTATPLPSPLPANKNNNAITSKTSSIIQQLLIPNTPKCLGKSTTHAVTTARVLTSKECLDIIKEKQLKKKAEEE